MKNEEVKRANPPVLMVTETEKKLIRELETYKKLSENYLKLMNDWERRAERVESDVDKLLGEIGEKVSIRALPHRIFGYDPGDAENFIDEIERIISILKREEWD